MIGYVGFSIHNKSEKMNNTNFPLQGRDELSSLVNATAWLNSGELTRERLRGKVVLVDFWTYTCINWRRTLPYLRAWASRYKENELVLIGVHTPEFEFEKKLPNVNWAINNMKIDFPVAVDNDYSIWDGFSNQFWPALYFFDTRGKLRHVQFGEGNYDEAEKMIQQLLRESGAMNIGDGFSSVAASGAELAADWNSLASPENYLGYARTENFSSPGGARQGKKFQYTASPGLKRNHWSVSGDWTINKELIILNKSNGRITYRFLARDLHLVMGLPEKGLPVKFRVLIDGKSPAGANGSDIDSEGNGTVIEQRMYHLIRQSKKEEDHLFEIEFYGAGVEAFCFTFG
jgi:thiol-disulfide isomerase/thioredoxin